MAMKILPNLPLIDLAWRRRFSCGSSWEKLNCIINSKWRQVGLKQRCSAVVHGHKSLNTTDFDEIMTSRIKYLSYPFAKNKCIEYMSTWSTLCNFLSQKLCLQKFSSQEMVHSNSLLKLHKTCIWWLNIFSHKSFQTRVTPHFTTASPEDYSQLYLRYSRYSLDSCIVVRGSTAVRDMSKEWFYH